MRVAFVGNHSVPYSSESHHAQTLEALGHQVVRLQENTTTTDDILTAGLRSHMLVWVHTHGVTIRGRRQMRAVLDALRAKKIPLVAYHLDAFVAITERWKTYQRDLYIQGLDHFFTVDADLADWLNTNTKVNGHYLPAGVLAAECTMATPSPARRIDVAFVGSRRYHPEHPHRPKLLDWLDSTYGDRFQLWGQDAGRVVRGAALNQLYADTKVVVGDSFRTPHKYFSDRVFETIGRGGFIIHPRVPGIEDIFTDGRHLALYDYDDFDGLQKKIDYYLTHDKVRERIRRAGHKHVKTHHTYTQRWEHILSTVFSNSPLPATPTEPPPPVREAPVRHAVPDAGGSWTVRDANEIQAIMDRYGVNYVTKGGVILELSRYVERVRRKARQ